MSFIEQLDITLNRKISLRGFGPKYNLELQA